MEHKLIIYILNFKIEEEKFFKKDEEEVNTTLRLLPS